VHFFACLPLAGFYQTFWYICITNFESKQIKLKIRMRKNQYDYKKTSKHFQKEKKRIETLFSQLCDQFMIRRNYTKTFI